MGGGGCMAGGGMARVMVGLVVFGLVCWDVLRYRDVMDCGDDLTRRMSCEGRCGVGCRSAARRGAREARSISDCGEERHASLAAAATAGRRPSVRQAWTRRPRSTSGPAHDRSDSANVLCEVLRHPRPVNDQQIREQDEVRRPRGRNADDTFSNSTQRRRSRAARLLAPPSNPSLLPLASRVHVEYVSAFAFAPALARSLARSTCAPPPSPTLTHRRVASFRFSSSAANEGTTVRC